jgi:BMFP domain-containing protein YqiC
MQKDNKFFEDIAKLASGAAGGFVEIKREIEDMVGYQLEKLLHRMNLVTREEFDTVSGMLSKLREEQENMKKKLADLEQKAPK